MILCYETGAHTQVLSYPRRDMANVFREDLAYAAGILSTEAGRSLDFERAHLKRS